MITRRLNATVAPIIVVCTLTAFATLAAFTAVIPLWRWSEAMDAEMTDTLQKLAKLQHIVRMASSTPAPETGDQSEDLRQTFLKGDQDAVVIADLQTRLGAVLVGKNCELISASTLPPRVSGGQTMLGLKLQIRGEMKSIHEVLYTIEYGTPFLFIERAELHLDAQRGAVQDDSGSTTPSLFAELDVYGAKWPLAASPANVVPTAGEGMSSRP
jgi:Type II secretion system (T2SS), protein M subtype b